MVAAWPRERMTTGGGLAKVALIVLTDADLPQPLPVSRSRHGIPDAETASVVHLVARDRVSRPDWFGDLLGSSLGDLLEQDLGPDAAARARQARFGYVIEGDVDDPLDLGHLQAAWALAKCVCEAAPGATVLDVYGAQAHEGQAVADLDVARPFALLREVAIMVDDDSGNTGTIVTRGLIKFGRPDLVMQGVPLTEIAGAAELVRELAEAMADGELIEPDDVIEIPDGSGRFRATDLPEQACEQLGLGKALLLSPA